MILLQFSLGRWRGAAEHRGADVLRAEQGEGASLSSLVAGRRLGSRSCGYRHFRGREQPYHPENIAVNLGPSPEAHQMAIREYSEAGFDHLILMQIGQNRTRSSSSWSASCAILFHHKVATEYAIGTL
jgi:hypothetical protein